MFYSQSWQHDSKVCVLPSWRSTIVIPLIVINSSNFLESGEYRNTGGEVLDRYLGIGEPLRIWNKTPVKDNTLREQIRVIAIAFVYVEYKTNSQKKSCRQYQVDRLTYK